MTLLFFLKPQRSGAASAELPHGGMHPGKSPLYPVRKRSYLLKKKVKKHSLKEFFRDMKSKDVEFDLQLINELEDVKPITFLKRVFGDLYEYVIETYGKKFMFKVRVILIELADDDEDDDDED